ncbi:MAG: peptide-methionine (R)-S-oxide reductase [Planctomycetes bacterium]|nr:peptide-methionine (R)-S-oxide reductase [Planctomycetota bacterium]
MAEWDELEEVDGKVVLTDDEWKKRLSAEEYRICRQRGTEPGRTGRYEKTTEKGMYRCVACGQELFASDTKFDSGSGWPAFWDPVKADALARYSDKSLPFERIEVRCGRCDAHLGHVFDDSPDQPTGMRYCVNSASLHLERK